MMHWQASASSSGSPLNAGCLAFSDAVVLLQDLDGDCSALSRYHLAVHAHVSQQPDPFPVRHRCQRLLLTIFRHPRSRADAHICVLEPVDHEHRVVATLGVDLPQPHVVFLGAAQPMLVPDIAQCAHRTIMSGWHLRGCEERLAVAFPGSRTAELSTAKCTAGAQARGKLPGDRADAHMSCQQFWFPPLSSAAVSPHVQLPCSASSNCGTVGGKRDCTFFEFAECSHWDRQLLQRAILDADQHHHHQACLRHDHRDHVLAVCAPRWICAVSDSGGIKASGYALHRAIRHLPHADALGIDARVQPERLYPCTGSLHRVYRHDSNLIHHHHPRAVRIEVGIDEVGVVSFLQNVAGGIGPGPDAR
eukprot:3941475-Rhodomonas_salina.6